MLRSSHRSLRNGVRTTDACIGFAAVMGCEIYETIAEVKEDMREEQKKRALDSWERMNVKRSLEDSLRCVLLYFFLDEKY